MPIMHRPQKTTTSFFGEGSPLEDRVPMTTEAESAEVMKKMESTTITTNGVNWASGRFSNTVNSSDSAVASPSVPGTP